QIQEIPVHEKIEQAKSEIKVELKQEIKPQSKPEPKLKSKQIAKQEKIQVDYESDPFAGIATKDIEKFSDIFDVPPPKNDEEAKDLAARIKKWISQGRTKTEETLEQEDVKPKKKHSLFEWRKK